MLKIGPRLSPLKASCYLSLLCDGVLSVMLGLIAFQALSHRMLDREVARTGAAVQAQVREHKLDALFRTPAADLARAEVKQRIAPLRQLPEVIGVKVYDSQGTILWADEARLVGRRGAATRELREALGGKTGAEFKQAQNARDLTEWDRYSKLAGIYVPIRQGEGGAVIGVVEVYKYPAPLLAHIQEAPFLKYPVAFFLNHIRQARIVDGVFGA